MAKTLVITGGIGSGKSLVCSYLSDLGIPVYDSDSRTKALYSDDPELLCSVEAALGRAFRTPEGRFDSSALAETVFGDPVGLAKLEAVVHPAVLKDFKKWKERHEGLFAVGMESAIILEKQVFKGMADWTLLVDAPLELRLSRAVARDGVSREDIVARMERQKLMNDISRHLVDPPADFVICNDGSPADLREKVKIIYNKIRL